MSQPRKILFICSQNRWRSPTAEKIFDGVDNISARSAGTEPAARIKVSAGLTGSSFITDVFGNRPPNHNVCFLTPTAAALALFCLAPNLPMFAQSTNEPPPHVLKPVVVTGKQPSLHNVLSEADRVGPADQPEW